jgi:DNA invertase Pin-like site-specific DNA recombinase
MRAALYARLSREDKTEEDLKIAHQLEVCRSFVAEQAGWEVVAELIDDGISGTVRNRPGLQRLLAMARGGELDVIVARDQDRMARGHHLPGWVWEEFASHNVKIITLRERNSSSLEKGVLSVIGAQYVDRARELITDRMREKASRQEYTGGKQLFGYRWVPTVSPEVVAQLREARRPVPKRREIDPAEAAVVARLFEMADPHGESRSLADISRELGLELQRVRRMLRHPGYAGAYTYSRFTFTGGRSKIAKAASPDRVVITWGAHEAIVPRDRWDRVQARLDHQAARCPLNDGQVALPLSGILRCASCKRPLRVTGTHHPKGGPVRYYYACTSPGCPGVGRVCVVGLAGEIIRGLLEQLRRPELVQALAAELRRAYEAGRRAGSWEAEIRRLERSEASLRAVITSGEVSDTRALAREYASAQRSLDRARASLVHDRRKSGVSVSAASIRARLAHVCDRLEGLRAADESSREARAVIHAAVEAVIVDAGSDQAVVQLHGGLATGATEGYPAHAQCWRSGTRSTRARFRSAGGGCSSER